MAACRPLTSSCEHYRRQYLKPILKKIILPEGARVPDELDQFERTDDLEIRRFRTREEFLQALGNCANCRNGFDEDGFYLDVFGQKYCPSCYERAARRPN